MTPLRSRHSVVSEEEGTRKPKGGYPNLDRDTDETESLEGQQESGSSPEGWLDNPAILDAREESRRRQVKHEKVMERVYEPGRLREAWQQVRRNAGAAGIDKMTVEEFERTRGGASGADPREA